MLPYGMYMYIYSYIAMQFILYYMAILYVYTDAFVTNWIKRSKFKSCMFAVHSAWRKATGM